MKLQQVKQIVVETLEESLVARDDDMVLYALVCKKVNPDVVKLPFSEVLLDHADYGIPNLESVGRARRKIQEQRQDLQSSQRARQIKAEREEEFVAFSRM